MAVRLIDFATAALIFALNPADEHGNMRSSQQLLQTEDKYSIT